MQDPVFAPPWFQPSWGKIMAMGLVGHANKVPNIMKSIKIYCCLSLLLMASVGSQYYMFRTGRRVRLSGQFVDNNNMIHLSLLITCKRIHFPALANCALPHSLMYSSFTDRLHYTTTKFSALPCMLRQRACFTATTLWYVLRVVDVSCQQRCNIEYQRCRTRSSRIGCQSWSISAYFGIF
jgi:hypothetical protein